MDNIANSVKIDEMHLFEVHRNSCVNCLKTSHYEASKIRMHRLSRRSHNVNCSEVLVRPRASFCVSRLRVLASHSCFLPFSFFGGFAPVKSWFLFVFSAAFKEREKMRGGGTENNGE